MKTYLVTGAAGFIGSNFIKYLLHKKYQNGDIKVIILFVEQIRRESL